MKDITCFSANVLAQFDNKYDNMLEFNSLMMDASNSVYEKYSKEDTQTILRKQFDKILGLNFKEANSMKRRQAWRDHNKEIATLIEDVIADKMNSGWNTANARFMEYVDERNIAEGDANEFFVEDNSLLTVSKFAGNHHDIVRASVKPGKAFSIDTSFYGVKVYTDFVLFQTGKVDFAALVDKMYKSIEENRYAALYTAFMGMDASLPTDMILQTAVSESTKDSIIAQIEAVAAATGKDVILVGTRPAIQKLQGTVNYNMFSDSMKDERNQNGILGNWEGYECLPLARVNKAGTRENVFSAEDQKKIFILPVDPEFKPIKRVNEGDVMYYETGMDGLKKDMTVDAEVVYQEGIGVVIKLQTSPLWARPQRFDEEA